MKTIIAGSRSIKNYLHTKKAIELSGFVITKVICGEAIGPDSNGKTWAILNNIPYESYPVTKQDWNLYGKSAGIRRNVKMSEVSEALILIWDGVSTGSKHMLDISKKKGIPTFVYTPPSILALAVPVVPDEENWWKESEIFSPHWQDRF